MTGSYQEVLFLLRKAYRLSHPFCVGQEFSCMFRRSDHPTHFSNKLGIESDHFIITLDVDSSLSDDNKTKQDPIDQVLGCWFSRTNISENVQSVLKKARSENWESSLISAGFQLNGVYPPQFSGVGVVLSFRSGTIHLIDSDGRSLGSDIRLDTGRNTISNFDFRRRGVKITLSINRKKSTFSVYAYDAERNRANMEISTSNIPPSGFFGVTAYSGTSGNPYRITLSQMRAMNLDIKAGTGEDTPSTVGAKHPVNMDHLIHEESETLEDPVHQIHDIHKATSVLSEYLADSRYRDSAMIRNLGDIQSRAQALQDAIDDLRAEIRVSFKSGGTGKDLYGEVMGLKELIRLHSEEGNSLEGFRQNLKQLQDEGAFDTDGKVVEQIAAANKELEEEVSKANFTANLVIGVFGVTVLLLGLLLYAKMRQYEKKHFL